MSSMDAASPHILVVDDDKRLRALLKEYLEGEGFAVTAAASAAEARARLGLLAFDAAVLDIMMPGEDGLSLARWLATHNDTLPVIMLTAMGELSDRINGLEAGADDYLPKPFEPRELTLRLRAVLRRSRQGKEERKTLRFGEYGWDPAAGRLTRRGDPVYLTGSETELLKLLAATPGDPVSRERLAQAAATGDETPSERSVDVQIGRLRKKIEPQPDRPIYIQTIRGAGYVLKLD